MFLQYFVLGAWYVTVGNYMAQAGMGEHVFWAYTVGPLAATLSPFFLGLVADRYFATEQVLAVLSGVGGLAILAASLVPAGHPLPFIALLLVHTLCYFPTLGLANTMAFHHITDRVRQFPAIRAFGSIGWITAGVVVSGILAADHTVLPLRWAAGASLVYALYALTLPHTPPPVRASTDVKARDVLGIDGLRRMGSRSYLVFVCCSVLISIPLTAYNAYAPIYLSAAGLASPALKMSLGQVMEVLIMFAMPLLFSRMGFKVMFTAGLMAWAVRYVLFALAGGSAGPELILAGVLLHGLCFNFVFISGRIYTDRRADATIRGRAHGFLVVITLGIGQLVGAPMSGWLFNTVVGSHVDYAPAWQLFWSVPALFSAAVLVLFALTFKEEPAPAS
jgi:nucleoside transporter